MTKVNLEVIKPWITKRVNDILGFEDDVVIEFIFNQLEEKVMSYFLFLYPFLFFVFCFSQTCQNFEAITLSEKGYKHIIEHLSQIPWVK